MPQYVTHLHEMSRMSAPYKLRKWAMCMIWANNSEFCLLSNFDALKPRITTLRPEWVYAPILVENDISHDCDYHIFCLFVFKMAAGGHLRFYPFKKTLEVNQSPPCRF